MASDKTYLVAIDNGCLVGKVKKVSDVELANAINNANKKLQEEKETIATMQEQIKALGEVIIALTGEIKHLKGED